MADQADFPSNRAPIVRRVFVSEDDVDAAERLLSLIARSRELSQRAAAGKSGKPSNRSEALEQAQIALALRQRRVRFFEGSFSAEPPFTLLLALYANQDREPVMTYTRLIQLAWVSSARRPAGWTAWLRTAGSNGQTIWRISAGLS